MFDLTTVTVILIILLLACGWYNRRQNEGFNLDQIKKEVRLGYQWSNPNIQYTVNPVPYLLDFLKGRSYYPATLPRRPDAIINPVIEAILRVDSVENTGNLPNLYDPPYAGPNLGVYRAYRYPHNDLHFTPWQLEISDPTKGYGVEQGN